MDVSLLELREKRNWGLLSGSKVPSISIHAELARRSGIRTPIACASPNHRAPAACGHSALSDVRLAD